MIRLQTPNGLPVDVPQTLDEDPSPRFEIGQADEIRRYYDEQGYVVITGVFDGADCETIRGYWNDEVKTSDRFIYRQATARAERNAFNENGWVMNPILNLQSVDPRRYPRFRDFATNRILSSPALARVFETLIDDRPKIVQSMYFEGNSATWEHQDTYYLDSERIGAMVAAWIAIEDIHEEAGRFFVCPGSHRIDMALQGANNNIATGHDKYIGSVVDIMRRDEMPIRAPLLRKGDVLFWNSKTVHGSLDSQHSRHSRSSVTCHAIPAADRFLHLQMQVKDLPTRRVNETLIYAPKDLSHARNRAVMWVESTFPTQFYWLKKRAIHSLAAAVSRRRSAAG